MPEMIFIVYDPLLEEICGAFRKKSDALNLSVLRDQINEREEFWQTKVIDMELQ